MRVRRIVQLLLVLLHEGGIDLDLWRGQGRGGDKFEVGIARELAGQPQERLLEVVVGLGRNVIVLQVLLPVECDVLGLHLAVLDVDLVAAQNDGDVLAHADEIAVPVGDVLVRNTGRHVEHDNGALALNVVAIAQTTELLLAGSVPHVEADGATVRVERQRVNLHTEGGCEGTEVRMVIDLDSQFECWEIRTSEK